MKKNLSLFLITFLVGSLHANTVLIGDKVMSKKQVVKETLLRNAGNSLLQYPELSDTEAPATTAELLPATSMYRLAAKSEGEADKIDTLDLYYDHFYNDPTYFEKELNDDGNWVGGDWYIVLSNERYQFIFDYFGGTPDDCTGTFTVNDLDSISSWARIPEANGKTSYYETCNFTVQKEKISNNLTRYVLDAFVTVTIGLEGEVYAAYNIHAEHTSITPTTIIETAFPQASLTMEEDMFIIEAENDSMEIYMPFYNDFGVANIFSIHDIDIDNCVLKYNDTDYTPMQMDAVITTAEQTQGGMAYVAFMEILTEDTTFFNIVLQAPILARDTVEFTCSNLVIDDQFGFTEQTIYFTASNQEYSVWGAFNDTQIKAPATYEGTSSSGRAGVIITELATERTIMYYQTKLTIQPNRKGGYVIYMENLGDDHILYSARMSWDVPTPVDTINIEFAQSAKAAYFPYDTFGNKMEELQLANFDGKYSVAFDMLHFKDILGKTFTLKELVTDYSFITKHNAEDGDMDQNVSFAQVEGSIYQSGDTTHLTASVIGFDSVYYTIVMYYAAPAPTSTVTYEFSTDEVEFTNALSQGLYALDAISEDETLLASIRVVSNQIEGTFVNDGKFEQYDFDSENTYIQLYNEETGDYDLLAVMKGTMTTTQKEDTIKAVASFICENAVQYDLTFNALYRRTQLQYDVEDRPVDQTYTDADSKITIRDFINDWGIIHVNIIDNDEESVVDLYFHATEMDAVIGVPAGEYPINDSKQPGTMLASRGVLADGVTASPSYYLTLIPTEDGPLVDEAWWMVAGNAVVKNDNGKLDLTINATNSYDVPVKIYYHGAITPVENVIATSKTTRKCLIDGNIVIVKDGKAYTILGTAIE